MTWIVPLARKAEAPAALAASKAETGEVYLVVAGRAGGVVATAEEVQAGQGEHQVAAAMGVGVGVEVAAEVAAAEEGG